MTTTITKGFISKEDMSLWDGNPTKTFTRPTITGGNESLSQIDWVGVDVNAVYGGRTNAELNQAISAIGSSPGSLFISAGDWTISKDVTIPSNITTIVPIGVTLKDDAGNANLTIGGPLEAGPYQIFDFTTGTGSVLGLDFDFVDWFGTNGAAFRAAIAAARDIRIAPNRSYTVDYIGELTSNQRLTCDNIGFKQTSVITYTNSTGNILNLNGNSIETGGFQLTGPGTGGSEVAINIPSGKWRNVIKNMFFDGNATQFKDSGFANVIEKFYMGAAGICIHKAAGAQITVNDGYCVPGSGKTILDVDAGTTISMNNVTFGLCSIGADLNAGDNVVFNNCHFEGSETSDILCTNTAPSLTIIGGRMGGTKSNETIDLAASGGNSNNVTLIGTLFLPNSNGHIQDNVGSRIVALGTEGLAESDLTVGDGSLFWDSENINIDESGNIATTGNTISKGTAKNSSYVRNVGTITNNSTTNFISAQASNITMSGWVTVSARRASENSSHIYQIHTDPSGVSIAEIGTGKDREAIVALTASVASTTLTIAIDTTTDDWAGNDINVTVTADLTTATGGIVWADL